MTTQQVWPGAVPGGTAERTTTDGTGAAEHWLVVLLDPQTGEVDSWGPYPREQAERLRMWCAAELDLDGLADVVALVAPVRS